VALSPDEDASLADDMVDAETRRIGDYLLGRQLGAGGMGVVYEARRLADDRRVALKLIRDFHVASPTASRRFTIEAEAAARLDHPNIVRIHEIGEADGQPFIAMDLIEGESLNTRIHGGEQSSAQEIALLMAKVARAVHHAHERGVLHRDLKPGNVLLDGNGEPHLTDFGLAKISEQDAEARGPITLTGSGDIPGTPSYMSPEQVSRGQASIGSDVYGLGAVLYALMAGRPPFQGATPLEVFKRIVEQPPERPRSRNPSLPADLETICLKSLEKDARHRYVSAEAFAQDLENFAAHRSIAARRAGPGQRSSQWVKRNPIGAALIASLFIGLSASLGLLKVVNDQRQEIQLDRDQAFDESMQRVSQIWRDPATASVTISARELAILAGRSPADVRGAKHQLVFGISANDGPSSMAQRYARLLGMFQSQMQRELGESVVCHLRLFKRFSRNEEALARGDADFIVLSAAEYLRAKRMNPAVLPLAHANTSREGVLFARTNSRISGLHDLRGASVAFPDPDISAAVWAKARLFDAGIRAAQLARSTNIVDRGSESGHTVVSTSETIQRVLAGDFDAGVTFRGPFERYRHVGLMVIESFPETPKVMAARAGLEPRFLEALRNALHSPGADGTWPESKFIAEPRHVSAGTPRLDTFRQALEKAERFEGRDR
jgi:serine/threonine protein kinase/ABC-type phosphate/phosphonate transport system substrate-binding protein